AGVWRCRLADERLNWTAGVYSLFGIRQGAPLRRQEILELYEPRSRGALEAARARAISEGQGFALDAEIITARGRSRWIRISATVGRGSRGARELYGLKQDVTEAKTAAEQARRLAQMDPVTGLANRALFEARLSALCVEGRGGALLLADLDGFKQVNDTFGHAIGDDCLRETGSRLRTACRGAALVARIGGDEFAVLLERGCVRQETERLAAAVVEA
ncbi:diguanylate cyclase domain-containing protein, partial [Hansschlegelia beijingensis]|uniref:diguanylate cyclase domain-containing protein n=1 Tax=Hansschlegelia beijingensis TaxID=1133344 RepID=UPI00387F0C79